MNLTKNFSLQEFNSRDGEKTPEKLIPNIQRLANNLQVLRDTIGSPIQILSGYRSPNHNKRVGGAMFSQHKKGKAGDLRVEWMRPIEVYNKILELIEEGKMEDGGLGLYDSFVHYDIRESGKARWNNSKIKL